MEILGLLVAVALLVVAFKWLAGPWLVLRMHEGELELVRGEPPGRLLADLRDIARHHPDATSRIALSGRGDGLSLAAPGLDDGIRQRVWNTILLHRNKLG